MWTLVVLCSVIASYGVRGDNWWTTLAQPEETVTSDVSCGGYLHSSSGTFYSPGYPDNYPDNSECIWYLRFGSGIVQLNFPFISIEDHPSCTYDAIYVYDGFNTAYRLLGMVCGNTTATFHSTGAYMTVRFRSDGIISSSGFRADYRVVAQGSCRYNCGYQVGSCSCSSSCEYRGNCCSDYYDYCLASTPETPSTTGDNWWTVDDVVTDQPSCRYNCGSHMGSCSCTSSCQYYGNCCHDYYYECPTSTMQPEVTTEQPSCRYNCGWNLGSCSCTSSCQNYGNCCPDYYDHCSSTTEWPTTEQPSCRYNCGWNLGSCSCSSSCQYYGNCCPDYYDECPTSTMQPEVTTDQPSCRYNCGWNLGSCSCEYSCQYYGTCCYDFYYECPTSTMQPEVTTDQPSCRYNCGSHMGSCSCTSSCQYYGNCCHDYYSYCPTFSTPDTTTPGYTSCGGYLYDTSGNFSSPDYPSEYPDNADCIWYIRPGQSVIELRFSSVNIENCTDCICDSISVYDGPDTIFPLLGKVCGGDNATFHSIGTYLTVRFRSDGSVRHTGFQAFYEVVSKGSCRYHCGHQVGACSCYSGCEHTGNCCPDYHAYCSSTTSTPETATPGYTSCGDYLYDSSGNFSSPNFPSAYPYDAECIWYIRPGYSVIELQFSSVNIENCPYCGCDSVSVYDGPSTSSRLLRKVCGGNTVTFHSTGSYLTVRFRTDSSGRHTGFQAFYEVVSQGSCRYNCGYQVGNCSCSSSCEYRGNCCYDYYSYCPSAFSTPGSPTTEYTSCGDYLYGYSGSFSSPNYPSAYPHNADCVWYIRPGYSVIRLWFSSVNIENCGNCGCDSVSVYDGSSTGSSLLGKVCGRNTATFYSTGSYLTVRFSTDGSVSSSGFRAYYEVVDYFSTESPVTEQPSCRYNCGWNLGSCSCTSSCQNYGNCCPDYYDYCSSTTEWPTTEQPSCRYNCGWNLGSCSCTSSCQYYGNCCPDYYNECPTSTMQPEVTTDQPSCRYNCGSHMGSCSCSSSCQYYGNCCHDYYYECLSSTTESGDNWWTVDDVVTDQPSCRYNCGSHMGSCSCSSSCQYYGNCCHDYYYYCPASTTEPVSPDYTSCGDYLYGYSGSFTSPNYPSAYPHYADCIWYIRPGQSVIRLWFSSVNIENCGNCGCDSVSVYDGSSTGSSLLGKVCGGNTATFYSTGSYLTVRFRTDSSVSYSGFRAYYEVVDYFSTESPVTEQPSCRYNCGWNLGSCSCTSSCQYYGNCCPDYYDHCSSTTEWPTTAQPSCRHNCGWNLGSCSCSSSCRYNGNCCPDYYNYCSSGTEWPTTATPCGGDLFGSGNFTSPNHPSFYPDDTYCTWRLRASSDQRIFLAFTYLQLENCCECDYIKVYDGSSYMGTVCNNSLASFHSSSNSMTVVFRSDGRVVARGFKAEFISSLPTSSGQVTCSSDNMNIVVQRSYLNSLGYDGDNLYLNNPHCRPQISSSQVIFRFPIEGCGNDKKIENGRVVYSNTLRADTSSYGEITRQVHLKINVACLMDQDSVSHIMYLVEHTGNSSIIGTGKFNTSMNFYTSGNFYYKVTQVPYKVTLNQNLYVQVDLRRQSSNLVIFLDTCVTSPSPHDFESRSYYLIRNGCPVDSTYRPYYTGLSSYARFRFKAFQFLRAAESVYIQCKVLICLASDSNSICQNPPNCRNRVARDLGTEHDSQTLVLGPIQLRASEKNDEETKEQDEA